MGPWELLADLPTGTHSYKDAASLAGFSYWYSVRSFDSGHADWNGTGMAIPSLESGHGAPETRTHLRSIPFVVASDKKDRFEDPVIVVPNPFRLDDIHRYPGGSEEIRFVNVPRRCKISIFYRLRGSGRCGGTTRCGQGPRFGGRRVGIRWC